MQGRSMEDGIHTVHALLHMGAIASMIRHCFMLASQL